VALRRRRVSTNNKPIDPGALQVPRTGAYVSERPMITASPPTGIGNRRDLGSIDESERWRTVVNSGAQYSKACEGASLPWDQIPPPPPLTRHVAWPCWPCPASSLLIRQPGQGSRPTANSLNLKCRVACWLRDDRSRTIHRGRADGIADGPSRAPAAVPERGPEDRAADREQIIGPASTCWPVNRRCRTAWATVVAGSRRRSRFDRAARRCTQKLRTVPHSRHARGW
jgi:hypothetical protein